MQSPDTHPNRDFHQLHSGALGALAYGPLWETRVISAENPDGSKGGAARWVPNPDDPDLPFGGMASELGVGWKVRPFIRLGAGEHVTLADIEGPGSINHVFITSSIEHWRALVIRIYWDDEEVPSVECPLGDFFAIGHDASPHQVSSLPIVVAPARGCNSYWQMPFRKRARITLGNELDRDAQGEPPSSGDIVAYRVLYRPHPVSPDTRYFHAQWRRTMTRRDDPEHTILDGVRGSGYYAGTYLAWTAFSQGWWGEGEVKFYLDGDDEFPTIADNGTEDYFGGAWCFMNATSGRMQDWQHDEQTFSAPFLGLPLADIRSTNSARRYSLYRWHVLDPIGFREDIRVTVQALGPGWLGRAIWEPRTDDIASVAVWYQNEPHNPFPLLPGLHERWGM